MITIVPAIDIFEGKCVRLTQGMYTQKKIYNENPLEVAKLFEDNGFKRLHLVDLEGAKNSKVVNHRVLQSIASKTNLIIDFGGGIKSDDDIEVVFNCGAAMATIGSIAVTNKDILMRWLTTYGSDKIIVGADSRDRKIAISGWLETTMLDLFDFMKDYAENGVQHFLCTDISKDGMMQGTAMPLYKEISEKLPELKIIASGGISYIREIEELNSMNVDSVIIGKAFYEGLITLDDLKRFL